MSPNAKPAALDTVLIKNGWRAKASLACCLCGRRDGGGGEHQHLHQASNPYHRIWYRVRYFIQVLAERLLHVMRTMPVLLASTLAVKCQCASRSLYIGYG